MKINLKSQVNLMLTDFKELPLDIALQRKDNNYKS